MTCQAAMNRKVAARTEQGSAPVSPMIGYLRRGLLWHLLPLLLMLLLTSWATFKAGQLIDQARQQHKTVTVVTISR